jgi:hypothetical protein
MLETFARRIVFAFGVSIELISASPRYFVGRTVWILAFHVAHAMAVLPVFLAYVG